jgi:hypothetical protein
MENGNEYLNSTDIARILGLTRRTVVTIMNDGQIKYSRVGVRSKRVDPIDLIIYLENMGNDRRAMAGFKRDIYKFLYSKYGNTEYWKEAGKQRQLFEKYVIERVRALAK